MNFEWDENKSRSNQSKHGIDFEAATDLWNDKNRVEIQTPYPIENRFILIGRIDDRLWSAVFTVRENVVRIISVRRARNKEAELYDQKENS